MNPRLEDLLTYYPRLESCGESIQKTFACLRDVYAAGGKLLICGNGGSAADADHISGELLKGFQSGRTLSPDLRERLGEGLADRLQGSLPAIPLTQFAALNTAYTNDVDAQYGYAQLTLGLGKPGDALLGISTSGNARNVLYAMRTARAAGLHTLGLSGESGGELREACDICIRVPSSETYRVQEYHLPIYHCLCLMIEDHFFADS